YHRPRCRRLLRGRLRGELGRIPFGVCQFIPHHRHHRFRHRRHYHLAAATSHGPRARPPPPAPQLVAGPGSRPARGEVTTPVHHPGPAARPPAVTRHSAPNVPALVHPPARAGIFFCPGPDLIAERFPPGSTAGGAS